MARVGADHLPGGHAESPLQIPPRGWWQVISRAVRKSSDDHVPMLAGGVAFFAFLAVFPALIAALTLYGLVADPARVARQMRNLSGVLPEEARRLVNDQLTAVTASSGGALTATLIVSLLAALWTTSTATSYLIAAVNLAHGEGESRGFVTLRSVALGLTLVSIVFVLLALTLVAVVPVAFNQLALGGVEKFVAQVVRWGLLVVMVIVGLAVVYRIAPNRAAPQFRWVSTGAVVATVLWLVGSLGFSVYVSTIGNYNSTYGALAGVIVLMLWLLLTCYVVLLGAEINAESERQTTRDSTTGEPLPMGQRGANPADHLPQQSTPLR